MLSNTENNLELNQHFQFAELSHSARFNQSLKVGFWIGEPAGVRTRDLLICPQIQSPTQGPLIQRRRATMTSTNGIQIGAKPITKKAMPSKSALPVNHAWPNASNAHSQATINTTPAINLPISSPPSARALSLSDVADQIGFAYATMRADWKQRVQDGRLPLPLYATAIQLLKVAGHPRWHTGQLSAWLQQNRPTPPPKPQMIRPAPRHSPATPLKPNNKTLRPNRQAPPAASLKPVWIRTGSGGETLRKDLHYCPPRFATNKR